MMKNTTTNLFEKPFVDTVGKSFTTASSDHPRSVFSKWALLLMTAVLAICLGLTSSCFSLPSAWADEQNQAATAAGDVATTAPVASSSPNISEPNDGGMQSITLNCIYNSPQDSDKVYTNTGKFLLLNDDWTGMVVHRGAAYTITNWKLDGTNFTATDHKGNQMVGTLSEDKVLTATYNGYDYQYQASVPAPITSLSPATWFVGLPNVMDEANILTNEQRTELLARAQEISDKYQVGVYIVVLSDMNTYCDYNKIETCAEEVRVGYQLGYGEQYDCLCLVMSMKERDYDLISYGPFALDKVFNDHTREWVADKFLSNFKKNDWYGGFVNYLNAADEALAKNAAGIPLGRPAAPIHIAVSVLISLLIAVPIAYLIARIFRNRLKNVSVAHEAAQYHTPEGAEITHREDKYAHTTTSRTYSPRPDDDSSSGGSSSHTSSSGTGHTSGKF